MGQGLLAAIVVTVGVTGLSSPAVAADPASVKVGMVQGMFRDIPPTMIQALSRPFRTILETQTGLSGDVELLADAPLMAKKLKEKKLDAGIFHGFEYAWVKAQYPELVPLVVANPHGGALQAAIIVHADSPAKKLADLEGDCLVITRGAKAHCLLYLDKIRAGLPKTAARNSPKTGLTPEEALNAVAAGEHTAVLVDVGSYNAYQKLQPGGAKQLKMLMQSDDFPQGVLLTRKGALPDETMKKMADGLTNAHKVAAYKPLMMMWNLQGFDTPPKDYEQQLQKCLAEYPAPNFAPAKETVPVKQITKME